MNKNILTISTLALAFVGGFLIFYNLKTVSTPPTQNNSDVSSTVQKWESKVDDQASVTITVTPTLLSAESGEWKFDVVMDTHSVELDQDMTKVAILTDDSGKEYGPVRWEGAPAGGHHREGVLVFSPITPAPKSIELKITGIADTVRTFNWQF